MRGFSLIEVLAAFVILAVVATALFRLFSASLNNASASEEWSRALQVAESQLEAASVAQPLREGSDRGTDETGHVRWETRVTPYVVGDLDPELERASENLPTRCARVSADVKFDGANGRERTFARHGQDGSEREAGMNRMRATPHAGLGSQWGRCAARGGSQRSRDLKQPSGTHAASR
jgi:general secretion pathway protein I